MARPRFTRPEVFRQTCKTKPDYWFCRPRQHDGSQPKKMLGYCKLTRAGLGTAGFGTASWGLARQCKAGLGIQSFLGEAGRGGAWPNGLWLGTAR